MGLVNTINQVAERIATMWRRTSRLDERITELERRLGEGQGKQDGQSVPPGSTVFQNDNPRLYRKTGEDGSGNITGRLQTIDANGQLIDDPDITTEYTLITPGDDIYAGNIEGIDDNEAPAFFRLPGGSGTSVIDAELTSGDQGGGTYSWEEIAINADGTRGTLNNPRTGSGNAIELNQNRFLKSGDPVQLVPRIAADTGDVIYTFTAVPRPVTSYQTLSGEDTSDGAQWKVDWVRAH